MATANQVSMLLIQLAGKESEPSYLTPLHLQKLLYYVQGWSLALRGAPAFHDVIEAWKYGPVVPDVYRSFKKLKGAIIDPSEAPEPEDINRADRAFTASVWEYYKRFSATELSRRTHQELPWLEAHHGFGPQDHCSNPISQATMARFFQAEFKKTEIEGLGLDRAIEMATKKSARNFRPFSEILIEVGLGDAAPSDSI